ncbi:class II histone deacetylase [Leucobacter chromiiresistens]|uniref:Acetoin utilization deacetylase AcuC n=1 Tax=Leucobacter chromiiresistens TaxID=1079994 RepID=A0A1H0Z9Q0_9MICO|nr:class II histone deacetylase [Leucobacter chromiiresistens]SDQ24074.1 Acetoin utilization deacetylase AcuC [Leucobacter chromiiresistens]
MERRTGYVWHERYAWHDTGTHAGIYPSGGFVQPYRNFESPESKARLAGLVEVSGLLDSLVRIPAREVSAEDLLRVHTAEHVERIREQSEHAGGDAGDGFSPFGRGGYDLARLAAGGTLAAAEAVLDGVVDNAYALVRPPGHHAEPDQGRGYCLFANIPVAIEALRAAGRVRRVAIFDYDVHHGNGAQKIYWDDPDVLTISVHQDRLFPVDSGLVDEQGAGAGAGTNINVPLPAGSGDGAYWSTVDEVARPAITAFAPDLILVSSGFDPSALDPLGRMSVTSEGFRGIAERLLDIADEACDGRIVFSHEGGYSAVHVPFCGVAVLEALSGVRTGVEDPFALSIGDSPTRELTDWQTDVIDRSAELARALGLVARRAGD